MALREELGGDVTRLHRQLDEVLDSEDSFIILVDGSRAISYGRGFGMSPCHLELLAVDIERAMRTLAGASRLTSSDRNRKALEASSACRDARPRHR